MMELETRCAMWQQRRLQRERQAFVQQLVRRRRLERHSPAGRPPTGVRQTVGSDGATHTSR